MGSEHFGESEESTDDELLDTTKRSVFGDIERWNFRRIDTRFGRDVHVPKITGCCVMPDGTVVFCDNVNSNVKVLGQDRTGIKSVIRVETGDPFDVDSFKKSTAVVSIPKQKAVQFIRILPGLKLEQQINLSGECYGVAVRKTKIYVCIPDVGIEIVNRTGEMLQHISCQAAPRYVFVNVYANRIYYSCDAGSVCCLTKSGHIVSDSFLPNSGSLVADEMNNLLVCNNAYREIHKLKPDGTDDKIIPHSDNSSDAGKFTSMCSNRSCEMLVLATAAGGNTELLLYEPNDEPDDEQGPKQSSGQSGHQRGGVSDFVVGTFARLFHTVVVMFCHFCIETLRK